MVAANSKITMRFPPELKEQLEKIAAADDRTLNSLCMIILREAVNGRLYRPAGDVLETALGAAASVNDRYVPPVGRPKAVDYSMIEEWMQRQIKLKRELINGLDVKEINVILWPPKPGDPPNPYLQGHLASLGMQLRIAGMQERQDREQNNKLVFVWPD